MSGRIEEIFDCLAARERVEKHPVPKNGCTVIILPRNKVLVAHYNSGTDLIRIWEIPPVSPTCNPYSLFGLIVDGPHLDVRILDGEPTLVMRGKYLDPDVLKFALSIIPQKAAELCDGEGI